MIDIKDLQIGDFILYHGRIYKVLGIKKDDNGDYRCLIDDDKHFGLWIKIEDIQPIPFTTEILEKNGIKHKATYTRPYFDYEPTDEELEKAKKNYPFSCYENDEFTIKICFYPEFVNMEVNDKNYNIRILMRGKCCTYVHQLQHCLKLCGIEREITV